MDPNLKAKEGIGESSGSFEDIDSSTLVSSEWDLNLDLVGEIVEEDDFVVEEVEIAEGEEEGLGEFPDREYILTLCKRASMEEVPPLVVVEVEVDVTFLEL